GNCTSCLSFCGGGGFERTYVRKRCMVAPERVCALNVEPKKASVAGGKRLPSCNDLLARICACAGATPHANYNRQAFGCVTWACWRARWEFSSGESPQPACCGRSSPSSTSAAHWARHHPRECSSP